MSDIIVTDSARTINPHLDAVLPVNPRIHADGLTVSYDDHAWGERDEVTLPTRDHARILVGLLALAEAAGLEILGARAYQDGSTYIVAVDVEAGVLGVCPSITWRTCYGPHGTGGFAYTGTQEGQRRVRATLRERLLSSEDRAWGVETGDILHRYTPAK